jgi:hypothetical protein
MKSRNLRKPGLPVMSKPFSWDISTGNTITRNVQNKALYIVPDWYCTGQVTLYEKKTGRVGIYRWKELSRLLSGETAE